MGRNRASGLGSARRVFLAFAPHRQRGNQRHGGKNGDEDAKGWSVTGKGNGSGRGPTDAKERAALAPAGKADVALRSPRVAAFVTPSA